MNSARLKDQASSLTALFVSRTSRESPRKEPILFSLQREVLNPASLLQLCYRTFWVCHLQHMHVVILRLLNTNPPSYL